MKNQKHIKIKGAKINEISIFDFNQSYIIKQNKNELKHKDIHTYTPTKTQHINNNIEGESGIDNIIAMISIWSFHFDF